MECLLMLKKKKRPKDDDRIKKDSQKSFERLWNFNLKMIQILSSSKKHRTNIIKIQHKPFTSPPKAAILNGSCHTSLMLILIP